MQTGATTPREQKLIFTPTTVGEIIGDLVGTPPITDGTTLGGLVGTLPITDGAILGDLAGIHPITDGAILGDLDGIHPTMDGTLLITDGEEIMFGFPLYITIKIHTLDRDQQITLQEITPIQEVIAATVLEITKATM